MQLGNSRCSDIFEAASQRQPFVAVGDLVSELVG